MGVQGLQGQFRHRGLISDVRVERVIQEFKSKRGPECIPKILIDCRQRTWIFKNDKKLFDCSWRMLCQRTQDLVSFFERLDCEVIVFKGSAGMGDKSSLIQKLSSDMQDFLQLLDAGPSGWKHTSFIATGNLNALLLCHPLFSPLVFHSICKMRISLDTSDTLMMAYAKENDACAIISDSTDCLAYDCNIRIILFSMLDVRQGVSKVYGSKRDYCNDIGINPSHFPIFCAAIKAREKIQYSVSSKQLIRKRYWSVTRALSKKRALSVDELLQEKNMSELSKELCLTDDESEFFRREAELFVRVEPIEPRRHVMGNDPWERILAESVRMIDSGRAVTQWYWLLEKRRFIAGTTIENYRNVDLVDNASKFRALRKRLYSYTFQELHGKCQSVEEYYPCGGSTYRDISVEILEPAVPSPGLLQLWDREREDLTNMRWKIFGSIISINLDIDSLQQLPEDLVLPVSIAFYMKHESGDVSIEDWELEALVFHPQLAPQLRLADRDNHINNRAMELFSTFLNAYSSVMLSVIASGFPIELKKVIPWDYHGIVFQQVYEYLSIHRPATVRVTRTDTYLRAKNILRMA